MGPDPLAPPYDVREALDEMGERILGGDNPRDALRDLLRRGWQDRRGLDDLMRRVRERQRELRNAGRLDGMLDQARELLDEALEAERGALFPDPSDDARLREAELDALPNDTSRAISQLSDYDWRSQEARQKFEQLRDLLRREVLDSQFKGMKQALENPDPAAMQRVKDMLADLRQMLDADTRGEHTQQDFDDFMAQYGDMFPDNPANLEELVDSLVRRMMAAERLLESLSDEQREELANLMAQAMEDAGLAAELSALGDALRARRPELGQPQRGVRMPGGEPLGLGDATSAVADMADLADLESALGQEYAGASLEDVDEEAVRRALGRQAVDDLQALRRLERELQQQGYMTSDGGKLELTPKAVRRLGDTALRQVFAGLENGMRSGDHDRQDAGQAGDLTGSTREWEFGDEQPIDVPAHRPLRPAEIGGGEQERRNRSADRRGLPGGGDRAAIRGGGLPARRPFLFDGAARHLGGGEADGAGAARAAADQVPAGRDPGHRVLQLRQGTARDGTRRPRLGHGPGHQPAPRADDRGPSPGQAPRARAGRADHHRRRADRAPDAGRQAVVRLAARAGDHRADAGRGGQDDQAARGAEHLHAGRRRPAGRVRR